MSENRPINEVAVDRREETVVTQQPGYASTEQVTRDVAAEGRLNLLRITNIIWTILSLLEISLGLRFVLKLIGANPKSGFSVLMYTITAPFLGSTNIPASPTISGIDEQLEATTGAPHAIASNTGRPNPS